MDQPLLDIRNLHVGFKAFRGFSDVLDGVDFQVWPGERVGLVGEMGCGKTTTMKAIMKLLDEPPAIINEGEIIFNNQDILKMKKNQIQELRKKRISMIFQDPMASLNPVFTIGNQLNDVIKYSKGFKGNWGRYKYKEEIIHVLNQVSLPDPNRIIHNYPIQLSGGMRQRISISMALVSSSELLIADEPGTALDVTIKDQVLKLLDTVTKKTGSSFILISHALGAVKNITDRTYVMYAGSMVETARTENLFSNPKHPYSIGLINSTPKLSGEGIGEGIPGRIPDYYNPPKGCRFHPRCKYVMDICINEKPLFSKINDQHNVACFLYKEN